MAEETTGAEDPAAAGETPETAAATETDSDSTEEGAPAAAPAGGDDEPSQDCPPCKGGAPGWMATFADMATLLMSFFVLLLSFSDTELPKFEQINGSIQKAFGVKRLVPSINIPKARSLLVENFSPALAERTVLDQQQQRAIDPNAEFLIRRTRENPEASPTEADFEKVQAALAEQIERGEVQVRIEDEAVVVEYTATASGGGAGGTGQQQSPGGRVSQQLVEIASIVTQVQSEVVSEVQLHRRSATEDTTEAKDPARDVAASATAGQSADSDRYNEIRVALRGEIGRASCRERV